MEKTINFKLAKSDYKKCLLSKIFNRKIFVVCYAALMIPQISLLIKNPVWSYIVAILLIVFAITVGLFIFYYFFMTFYSAFIFNRDPILKAETTINFHEQDFEEITPFSSLKVKYKGIYKIALLKSALLIWISPARVVIVPKSSSYDIKELCSEVKRLKENK